MLFYFQLRKKPFTSFQKMKHFFLKAAFSPNTDDLKRCRQTRTKPEEEDHRVVVVMVVVVGDEPNTARSLQPIKCASIEKIFCSGTGRTMDKGNYAHNGRNDDDENKTNNNELFDRNGFESAKMGDDSIESRKEYYRWWMNDNVNGVGCSPLTLILLTIGFDVVIEITRKALAENPEEVKVLLFFYERMMNSIKNFFGFNNGSAGLDFSSSAGGLSLVCD